MKGNLSLLGPILDENRVFFSDWLIINQYLRTWRLETVTYRPTYPKGTMIANLCISLTVVVTAWHFLHSVCTKFLAKNDKLERVALKNTLSIWRQIMNMWYWIWGLQEYQLSSLLELACKIKCKLETNEWKSVKFICMNLSSYLDLRLGHFVTITHNRGLLSDWIDKWWRGFSVPNGEGKFGDIYMRFKLTTSWNMVS